MHRQQRPQGRGRAKELQVVGYWKPLVNPAMAEYFAHQPESEYPDPRELVDERWRVDNPDAYDAVLEHLAKGEHHAAYKGSSTCRICGITNGSEERTDGVYYWPTGYSHYIRDHAVRPPTLFVRHVLGCKLRARHDQDLMEQD